MSNRIETAEYWQLEYCTLLGWELIDMAAEEVPATLRHLAHNCRFRFQVSGFLRKDDAVNVAIDLSKFDRFNHSVRVVHVVQQHEIQRKTLKDERTTECVISNDE